MSLESIKEFVENSKSFEVKYGDKGFLLEPYKGISKTDSKDVKKFLKKSRTKISKNLKEALIEISSSLISKRIEFKLIFEKEPLLKFDLDRYLKFEGHIVKVFGFKREDEEPLSYIANLLRDKFELKFYKPVA
jgi:hypothetical protein